MPRASRRLVLILTAAGLIALLNLTPALAQGMYPGGYMSSSGGMAYQAPAQTGSSYTAAPSYRPPAMSMPYGMQGNPYFHFGFHKFVFYKVHFGDTLTRIARRFGTSVAAILHANPGIHDPDVIFAGQILVIPVGHARPVYGANYSMGSYGHSAAPQTGYGY